MTSALDDFELIRLIEKHPILYDKSNARGIKNGALKDAAWREISDKLGASERACITRWKSLRDRFGKEFRRVQENPDESTSWDMFPHLLFLKEHYKQGQAKLDCLDSIKFEPRGRRRRGRHPKLMDTAGQIKREDEDLELDDESVSINKHLIDLVKKHPVLYDRQKIRDSKNITAKNDAWREISATLNISELVCYKRWKKLRDRFAREYRNHHINTGAPVTWVYFRDLLFLETHYRKGVPLIVENLKRSGRPPKNPELKRNAEQQSLTTHTFSAAEHNNTHKIVEEGSVWGAEYPYSSEDEQDLEAYVETEDEVHMMVPDPENDDKYIEVKTAALEDYIILPQSEQQQQQQQEQSASTEVIINEAEPTHSSQSAQETEDDCHSLEEDEPAEKLSNVITNLECVLRQTQDCLKSIEHQKQRHQLEMEAATSVYQPQAGILAKAQMLLDGLSAEQRQLAERKIIKFLCECQIKEINNEEIEELKDVNIY